MPTHARNSQDPFPPFSPLSPPPVIEIPVLPIIDAVTLCEVIVRNNSTPIHGESSPAFQSITYYIIQRRSDPVMMHSLTRPTLMLDDNLLAHGTR